MVINAQPNKKDKTIAVKLAPAILMGKANMAAPMAVPAINNTPPNILPMITMKPLIHQKTD